MRYGRFTIAAHLIRSSDVCVKQVMSKCIVVRAEQMFCSDVIEYAAISEHFRDLPQGAIAPEYRWICSDVDGVWAEELTDPTQASKLEKQ